MQKHELEAAIKSLKQNKCPGIDGFSSEFYQYFYTKLGDFWFALFSEIIEDEFLNDSGSMGIMSLIDKPDRDGLLLPNWCPLTLLATDYKILAKIIVNRIQPLLNYFIHPQQTGFMKNRYIAENILDLLNIVERALIKELPFLVVSFDLEKAFDRIEHPALWAILNKFGFGPKIMSMIRILYTNASRRIINNGTMSEPFSLARGMAQGCPWSPFAFILAFEPLSAAIRHNNKIKGMKIGEEEKKAAQYADDLWACIEATGESLSELVNEVRKYCSFTGMHVNLNKSEILRIGSWRYSHRVIDVGFKLKWNSDCIKVLGILVTPHSTDTCTVNYKEILSKIKSRLALWKDRSLSTLGKIQICNALASSLAVYKFMALPSPNYEFFKEVRTAFLAFIWDNKPAKINFIKLTQSYEDTGLKLCDLEIKNASLKCIWICKLADPSIHTWWKAVAAKTFLVEASWL